VPTMSGDSTPRIRPLPAEEQDQQAQELLAGVRVADAPAANIFATLVRHPGLFRRWLPLGGKLLAGKLPARDRELLILRTAVLCQAEYEWGQHRLIGMASGVSEAELSLVQEGPGAEGWEPFDAELMERVFFNLILNATQATAPGGAVTVKARAFAGTAEISIIDRGAGIDPKNYETIFNPFFTTKPQGVGLGLAIVSKIVDEHGGKITVESEVGKGSVFHVLLPMSRQATPSPTTGRDRDVA